MSNQAPAIRDRRLIRQRALDLLSRREHGHQELCHKLCQRGFDRDQTAEVLAQLVGEGLLSDERFTEAFIHARRQCGKGPQRIRAELRERGISDLLIDTHLDERNRQWLDVIRDVQQKRFGGKLPQEWNERARQARFLRYRGFTEEQIKVCLNDTFEVD